MNKADPQALVDFVQKDGITRKKKIVGWHGVNFIDVGPDSIRKEAIRHRNNHDMTTTAGRQATAPHYGKRNRHTQLLRAP